MISAVTEDTDQISDRRRDGEKVAGESPLSGCRLPPLSLSPEFDITHVVPASYRGTHQCFEVRDVL